MAIADNERFGIFAPGRLDRMILAMTTPLPDTWLGLRTAMVLRRAVIKRLRYPDGALDVERWGLRLRLHPRDNGCEKNLLFTPLMYEPAELAELESDITKARKHGEQFVFVDIGANVGLFSLFVAACAGKGARILAIEPEPGNLRRLKFNVEANPGLPIEIIPTALSDEASELVIALDRRDRGGSRTRKPLQGEPPATAPRVLAQALLQVLLAARIEGINALKIDVEGFEEVILPAFFRDAPPRLWPRLIIIEDCRASWNVDLMAIMLTRGYTVVACSKHKNLILRLEREGEVDAAAGRDAAIDAGQAAKRS
jgi:FkbM family methyltransferase